MEPVYKKQKLEDQIDFYHNKPSIDYPKLPNDIFLEAFSYLTMNTLGKMGTVSKDFDLLTKKLFYEKKMKLIQEVVFSPKCWNFHFGENCISSEESLEALDALKPNLDEISCKIHSNKKMIETHAIFWLPKTIRGKGLNLINYGALLKEKYPLNEEGYHYIWNQIVRLLGRKTIEKSRWIALKKDLLPESFGQEYQTLLVQLKKLNREYGEKYEFPSLLASIVCLSLTFFKTGKLMFESSALFCKEKVYTNFYSMVQISQSGISVNADVSIYYAGLALIKEV